MPETIRVGDHHANRAELWLPPAADGPLPVVVLIHGGYWRARYTMRLMDRLAAAVVGRGWAAWNIEYRRTGLLGGGGGWPATFEDVALAVDHLTEVPAVDPGRVVTCGHSAGGHLALWAAARSRLSAEAPGAGPKVRPRGAVSLAGVVDLIEASALRLGDGAADALLGGGPDRYPTRYAQGSPAALVPLGVPQVMIHGLADATVPPSMSERYAARATAAGDDATYIPVNAADHMDVIDPDSAAWVPTAEALARLV